MPTGADHCDTYVTLECLRKLYNFYYEPVVPQKNTIGVGMWLRQSLGDCPSLTVLWLPVHS